MKNIILTLVFALAFLGCDRSSGENEYNPQLPPITQSGANTFGAIINGKVMVPRNSIGYVPPGSDHYPVKRSSSSEYEDIFATDGRTNMGTIYIYIKNIYNLYPIKVENYMIGQSDGAWSNDTASNTLITARVFNSNTLEYNIYLSIPNTGGINVTKSDPNIISGTFSCKLKNKDNPNDIIEITDGRFDFNKSTINSTNFP